MKMEGADARAEENLFCLAVLVAALPVTSGQDRFWGQEYASTTGRVWHYSMSKTNKKKHLLNWVILAKDIEVCVKLLSEVYS